MSRTLRRAQVRQRCSRSLVRRRRPKCRWRALDAGKCASLQFRRGPPDWMLQRRPNSGPRQVVAQGLEQAPAAFLAVRRVGPELVEEDAVLDVREPGACVDRLELQPRHRCRHVDPVEPHVVRRDDADVLDDVGVRGLVPRDRTVVKRPLGDVASADAEVEPPLAGLNGVARAPPGQLLLLVGERVPDAPEGSGVVAGQGEPSAGESAFDRHLLSYRVKVTWIVPLSATSVVTLWVSSKPRRSSHSRVPRPSRIGAIMTCKSSTRPARRKSRAVLTPPPTRTSRPPAASAASASTSSIAVLRKWNVVPPCIGIDGRGAVWVRT